MYIEAADFHSGSRKVWTEGLPLDEGDGDESYLEAAILVAQGRIEDDLGDVFEAPNPDDPIALTLSVRDASRRLSVPRRIRSITSVQTRDISGNLSTQSSTLYRYSTSTDPVSDYLSIIDGLSLSTGWWPVGLDTVVVTGRFGYVTPPDDIKRLCALYVYDYLRPKDDPFSSITERTTADGSITYGDGEAEKIARRYKRFEVLAA